MERQKRISKRIIIALLLLVTNISLFGCMHTNASSSDSNKIGESGESSQEDSSSSDGNVDLDSSEIFVDGDGIMEDPYDDLDGGNT